MFLEKKKEREKKKKEWYFTAMQCMLGEERTQLQFVLQFTFEMLEGLETFKWEGVQSGLQHSPAFANAWTVVGSGNSSSIDLAK